MIKERKLMRQRLLADEPVPDNIEIIQVIEEVKIGRRGYRDEWALDVWAIVTYRTSGEKANE